MADILSRTSIPHFVLTCYCPQCEVWIEADLTILGEPGPCFRSRLATIPAPILWLCSGYYAGAATLAIIPKIEGRPRRVNDELEEMASGQMRIGRFGHLGGLVIGTIAIRYT